jgi:DNA-3-methyladenine glycosylase
VGGATGGAALTRAALARLLAGEVTAAARALLGCELSGGGVTLRLTEVEAYGGTGDDAASHAYRGRTRRNEVMFSPAGLLYVYFTYGMHWCLNVVCGQLGEASAVLLRAGEVVGGVELARERRSNGASRPLQDRELARGPARLAIALGVDGGANATALLDGSGPVTLSPPRRPVPAGAVHSGPRVGVAGAAERPWRFWLAGEASVSPYRPHTPRRRLPPSA